MHWKHEKSNCILKPALCKLAYLEANERCVPLQTRADVAIFVFGGDNDRNYRINFRTHVATPAVLDEQKQVYAT